MECWREIDFLGPPICLQCALPLPFQDEAEMRCAACLARPPAYDRTFAAAAYGDLTRRIALKLKYGTRPATALTVAKLMARNVMADDAALVVPVPLHRWRIWSRGYNQSALVAAALGKQAGLPTALSGLLRVRSTPPLKAMNQTQRRDTVRGAFAVGPGHAFKGRRILLVDDVYTTGSTANACAKVLKQAGATSVELHVWARVVRPATLAR